MTKTTSNDGRGSNRPPAEHQIRPGEVRNPHGRRGKPGPLSQVERLVLEEARRIVSRDENGEVSAEKRLVQEEFAAALLEKDDKARARLIDTISSIEAKADRERSDFVSWVLTCKAQYEELFNLAEVRRTTPPDVAHPAHLDIYDDLLIITGPLNRASRERWEELKASIKIVEWLHRRARENWKLSASNENRAELKRLEGQRRWLMRSVPKGWNWREGIYCRYSRTKFAEDTISKLGARS